MFSNKSLKKLILPLMIEQVLLMLVGIADTVMISYAGEAEISGVALSDMVGYLIITVLSAVASGGAVVVSQYLGKREEENARRTAGHTDLCSNNGILPIVFQTAASVVFWKCGA